RFRIWGSIDRARTRGRASSTPVVPPVLGLSAVGGGLPDPGCILPATRLLQPERARVFKPLHSVAPVLLVPGVISATEWIDASGLPALGRRGGDWTRCGFVRGAGRICSFVLAHACGDCGRAGYPPRPSTMGFIPHGQIVAIRQRRPIRDNAVWRAYAG